MTTAASAIELSGINKSFGPVQANKDIDLAIRPARAFADLGDEVERTIDYDAVARRVRALCAERPRKLIETLADEIADCVVREFGAAEVTVGIDKFILPDTDEDCDVDVDDFSTVILNWGDCAAPPCAGDVDGDDDVDVDDLSKIILYWTDAGCP